MSSLETKIAEYKKSQGENPLLEQVAEGIFGISLEPYLDAAIQDPEGTQLALDDLLHILQASEKGYFQEHPEFTSSQDSLDIILGVQNSVQSGIVERLPKNLATSMNMGKFQTGTANTLLSSPKHDRVASWLASISYAQAGESILPSGTHTLQAKLSDLSKNARDLPLAFSNIALANILSKLLIQRKKKWRTHIVDLGSGRGMTLAHAILAATKAESVTGKHGDIRFTGIEISTPLHDDLVETFAPQASQAIQALQHAGSVSINTDIRNTRERFSLFRGDILDLVPEILSPQGIQQGSDIHIFMGNYTFLRIPHMQQLSLLQDIAGAKNSILLVADLVKNNSAINREVFNVCGNYGPLNCGTSYLKYYLDITGFKVIKVDAEFAEHILGKGKKKKDLISGIQDHSEDDGMILIAYKGKEAEEMVTNMQKNA